jgi:hypothetical protein
MKAPTPLEIMSLTQQLKHDAELEPADTEQMRSSFMTH